MWNTNLPTAWLWVDKDKQGLGASHWGNLKKYENVKIIKINIFKSSPEKTQDPSLGDQPGLLPSLDKQNVAFVGKTQKVKGLQNFMDFSKSYLSSTVGQIAVGGRTWSWKFDINLTNIIGFHPRVRPHSSFSASKTKNPMNPFLPFVVFFSNC